MNQMEIFKSPEFGSIRVIEENDKYLFCGLDVANSLGYSNPRDAIIRHCRCVVKRDAPHPQSPDRKISMTFIPEGDVYRLIVHSKLPSAERFERWVFDEVLPIIRKHGAYMTKEKLWEVATSPEALLKLCSDLLAERQENAALREKTPYWRVKPLFMTCSSTSSTAPISVPLPKSWLCRSASLSDFYWNGDLFTARHPGMCFPTPSPPITACSVSKTTATTGIPVPTRW